MDKKKNRRESSVSVTALNIVQKNFAYFNYNSY